MTTERGKQWQYRLTKVAQSDQTDVLSEESESLAVGSQAVLLGPFAELTIRPGDAAGEINRHAQGSFSHRLGETGLVLSTRMPLRKQ